MIAPGSLYGLVARTFTVAVPQPSIHAAEARIAYPAAWQFVEADTALVQGLRVGPRDQRAQFLAMAGFRTIEALEEGGGLRQAGREAEGRIS